MRPKRAYMVDTGKRGRGAYNKICKRLPFHLSSLPPRPFAGSSRPFTQSFTDIAGPAAVGFIGKRFRKKRNEQNNPYRGYPPQEYTPAARSAGSESRRPLPIECCLAAPPGPGPAHSPAGNKRIRLHARHTGSYDSRTVTLATQGPPALESELPPRKKDRQTHRGTQYANSRDPRGRGDIGPE